MAETNFGVSFLPQSEFELLLLVLLESLKGSGSHSVADTVRSVLFAIASRAVDLVIGSVVQIGRIQWTVAIAAIETAPMPDSVFANHLLGGVDGESATRTSFTFGRFQSRLGLAGRFRIARSADQSGRVAVAETFGSVAFAVTGLAVDILVGSVAGQNRIQRPVAVAAVEAQLVPFLYQSSKSLINWLRKSQCI